MRRKRAEDIPIEVETRTLEEVQEVLRLLQTDKQCMVTRVMLDNMTKQDPAAPGK